MYQPWVAAATLVAGAGIFAYALTLEQKPDVPSLRPLPDSVQVVPPPAAAPVPEPKDEPIQIEPVIIEARPKQARVESKLDPVATRPCSTWREIGPRHVVAGQASGAVSVRELCL